jgi:hypothetical protein
VIGDFERRADESSRVVVREPATRPVEHRRQTTYCRREGDATARNIEIRALRVLEERTEDDADAAR